MSAFIKTGYLNHSFQMYTNNLLSLASLINATYEGQKTKNEDYD